MARGPTIDAESARRFGHQIAERRLKLDLTQERVAELVGISRVQLQNIEQGLADRAHRRVANPQLGTLVGLCRALGGNVRIDFAQPTTVTIEFVVSESGSS